MNKIGLCTVDSPHSSPTLTPKLNAGEGLLVCGLLSDIIISQVWGSYTVTLCRNTLQTCRAFSQWQGLLVLRELALDWLNLLLWLYFCSQIVNILDWNFLQLFSCCFVTKSTKLNICSVKDNVCRRYISVAYLVVQDLCCHLDMAVPGYFMTSHTSFHLKPNSHSKVHLE